MNNEALQVHELLERLLDKPCTSSQKKFTRQVYRDSCVFGRFLGDDDTLLAVISADAGFACYTGAAMMMLSPSAAEDAKTASEFPEEITDSFDEVLNVISRLFNTSRRPHCRYSDAQYGKASDEIKAFIKASSSRRSYDLEVGGYGEGTITLFAA